MRTSSAPGFQAVACPVASFIAATFVLATESPPMLVNCPPTYTLVPETAISATVPFAFGFQAAFAAPAPVVLSFAARFRALPPMLVNAPPT